MEIRFQTENSWQCDVALFFTFDNDTMEERESQHQELFSSASWIAISPSWRDFKAKAKTNLFLYGHKDNDISRACVVGLGKKEKLSIEIARDSIANAIKACKSLNIEHIGLDISSVKMLCKAFEGKGYSLEYLVEELSTAAFQALYNYDVYKSKNEEDESQEPKILSLLVSERHVPDGIQKAARLAEANYSGIALARDLANMPANVLTPEAFAQKAEEIAKKYQFKYTVFDEKKMAELGMNAFIAVGQGSANPPRCIFLEYTPKNCVSDKPYVIVGKGITFDTGGISLKPSSGMDEMKTDMSGAADVLGLFETLGQAQFVQEPNRPIIGVLACAENMPDGNAVKPGDIVKAYNGKTVEITNTDAEGRLVLIDALAFAQKEYKPEIIIDIATLTGACAVALGLEAAGLFVNNEELHDKLMQASKNVGEILWRMPLWPHMLKKIESPFADLDNAGPRYGGALTAAVFIEQFIEENQAWAHIDIAGPNFTSAATPLCPKGGTGFGARILIDFVRG